MSEMFQSYVVHQCIPLVFSGVLGIGLILLAYTLALPSM